MITLLVIVFWASVALYLARPLIGWLFRNEPFRLRRHLVLELVILGSLILGPVIVGFTSATSR